MGDFPDEPDQSVSEPMPIGDRTCWIAYLRLPGTESKLPRAERMAELARSSRGRLALAEPSRMGDLTEFQTTTRLFLKAYPWRRIDPVPWTPLRRSLAESKLALVSSAGFVMPGEEPFDTSRRGGDPSFREIPTDADPSNLVDTHRSQTFDHSGMQRDANLAFPLDRARELVEMGRIASLTPHHLSFMGGITAPGRLAKQTAPAAVSRLVATGADIALLVPV